MCGRQHQSPQPADNFGLFFFKYQVALFALLLTDDDDDDGAGRPASLSVIRPTPINADAFLLEVLSNTCVVTGSLRRHPA